MDEAWHDYSVSMWPGKAKGFSPKTFLINFLIDTNIWRADPPMPPEVDAAGQKVLDLCKENGLYFLDNVLPNNVKQKVDWGVMIGAGSNHEAAIEGRKYTKRVMPWH